MTDTNTLKETKKSELSFPNVSPGEVSRAIRVVIRFYREGKLDAILGEMQREIRKVRHAGN